MPGTTRRTARACERCRQTRRRCEPPYPCRSCAAAGVACDVRTKARPQRRQQHHCALPTQDASASNLLRDNLEPPRDTFELLKALVHDVLLERHGYALDCALVEPTSCQSSSLLVPSDTHPPPSLNSAQAWRLLTAFRDFMGWQDAKLVDVKSLHDTVCAHRELLAGMSPSEVSTTVTARRVPVDSIALVFGALALGAIAIGKLNDGRFYFGIATELIKHFVGRPTLELCLAYFLQHVFALRTGTSNYAQGIIAQAIQNAHDLGLHRNTHGIQGLQLYLLIYMADQYCSLTYNTEPIIRTSELQGQIFAPLRDAEPQLQTLIDLVMINGSIIEHSHQRQSPPSHEILELEARIGDLCSRQIVPVPARQLSSSLRTAYEPLARVHMWCCRLRLRAPGLSKQATWLTSLCICVHAAEGVLATYLQLYRPVLLVLARQGTAHDGIRPDKSSEVIACRLATTWRQVKRIMMSAFVIVFAYWHGEMVHGEAARYMAMARLLLEYPRWRWGEKLDEALRTLLEMSSLADFPLCEHMQMLLPGISEPYCRKLCAIQQALAVAPSPTMQGLSATQTVSQDTSSSISTPWPSIFDLVSPEGLSDTDISSLEHLPLFGPWETLEFPIEASPWISDLS